MADDTGATPSAAGSSPAPSSTPVDSTPASATATPSGSAAPAAPGSDGPLPYERHKAILDGAYSERDAAKKAFDDYKQQTAWVAEFQQRPWDYLDQWIDQAQNHQEYGPKLLAKAANMLRSRRGSQGLAPEIAAEPQPDVPIVNAQGQETGQTYSAKRLKEWQEWNWTQREAALNERLQPLEQSREKSLQTERDAQVRAQSAEHARTTLDQLRQDPIFKEHEAAIKAEFAAHEEYGDNIQAAAFKVLTTQVLPKVSQTEQARVLDSLKTQAAGGTVNPAGTGVARPPKFKNFGEAAQYYAAHPEEADAMANR